MLAAGLLGCLTWVGCLDMSPGLLEADEPAICSDGLDNDGDGRTDYPFDPGCESAGDPAEDDPLVPRACSDGLDNDGDGLVDFDPNHNGRLDVGEDPGCEDAADDEEANLLLPQCSDGLDNDGDGRIDLLDAQCDNRNDNSEAPACSNAIDDDGDGATDYPADSQCDSATDDHEQW